jgi:methionyl-tRNA formyltransferase
MGTATQHADGRTAWAMSERTIYRMLRAFNDFKAVKNGRVGRRVTGRLARKFFR